MTSGKLRIEELEQAIEAIKKTRPCPLVAFHIKGIGTCHEQLKMFLEYNGFGFDYFYYPGKGYYDRHGNLYKDLPKE